MVGCDWWWFDFDVALLRCVLKTVNVTTSERNTVRHCFAFPHTLDDSVAMYTVVFFIDVKNINLIKKRLKTHAAASQ